MPAALQSHASTMKESAPLHETMALIAADHAEMVNTLAITLAIESDRSLRVQLQKLARASDLYDATPSWPCMAPSAQRPRPVGDGPPDFVRRIFLNEMDPRHHLLGQSRPPADEVDQRIIGEDRTWLSLQEQLGHLARPQPVRVFSRDRMHIGGLALDGYLPGPGQRRPSPLARLGERPSILRHLLVGELTQDGVRQDLFNEIVVLQDHRLAGLGTQ